MALPRKIGRYKQYLDPDSNAEIPARTLRRWRQRDRQQQHQTENHIINAQGGDDAYHTQTIRPNPAEEDSDTVVEPMDAFLHPIQNHSVDEETAANPDHENNSAPTIETEDLIVDDDVFFLSHDGGFNVGNLNSSILSPEELDKPLAANLEVSKFETMLMIFHMALRHGMTWVFLEDMLKFVNKLVGGDAIPSSKYLFQKLFMSGNDIDVHFYCPKCQMYLGHRSSFKDNEVICECEEHVSTVTSLNSGNYFVTVSVKDQLEKLLSRPDIDLKYAEASQRQGSVISDIYDGLIYKQLVKYCKQMNKPAPLTISVNTDGSPVFKSASMGSLWPIQFILNEICPTQRFDLDNVMIAGLWFGSSPNMEIFFKPFVDELKSLSVNGVTWKQKKWCNC